MLCVCVHAYVGLRVRDGIEENIAPRLIRSKTKQQRMREKERERVREI